MSANTRFTRAEQAHAFGVYDNLFGLTLTAAEETYPQATLKKLLCLCQRSCAMDLCFELREARNAAITDFVAQQPNKPE